MIRPSQKYLSRPLASYHMNFQKMDAPLKTKSIVVLECQFLDSHEFTPIARPCRFTSNHWRGLSLLRLEFLRVDEGYSRFARNENSLLTVRQLFERRWLALRFEEFIAL